MNIEIPYVCVGGGAGNYKWRWGRATSDKVIIGQIYVYHSPSIYKDLGYTSLYYAKECYDRDYESYCLIDAFFYFTKSPRDDDDVMVGSRSRNLGATTAVCEDEFIWGDQKATLQEVCFAGKGYTTCSKGKWTAGIYFQPFTKKWRDIQLTDLIVVGMMSDQRISGDYENPVRVVLPNWGTITSIKQQLFNHFVTKPVRLKKNSKDGPAEHLCAFAYLGYPTQKLTEAEKVKCCMGRPSGSINEAICRFYNIMGQCTACDVYMRSVCSDPSKIKSIPGFNPNYCACINSEVPQAHCFDVSCSNEGYKFMNMNTPCTGAYVKCDQFNEIAGNEDLNLDTVAIKQVCPGFGAPQTADATPELDDVPPVVIAPKKETPDEIGEAETLEKELRDEIITGVAKDLNMEPEAIKEKLAEKEKPRDDTPDSDSPIESIPEKFLFYNGGKIFGDDLHNSLQDLGISDTEFILFGILIIITLYISFGKKKVLANPNQFQQAMPYNIPYAVPFR